MTGHPVQLPRSSPYRRFALASHQGEVVVFRGPTPERWRFPLWVGPVCFLSTPLLWLFPRCPELLMYPTVLALRICMCMLFTFDFLFSCLSSRFVFFSPILRRGCIFFHVEVCCPCPFGTCVPLLARWCGPRADCAGWRLSYMFLLLCACLHAYRAHSGCFVCLLLETLLGVRLK